MDTASHYSNTCVANTHYIPVSSAPPHESTLGQARLRISQERLRDSDKGPNKYLPLGDREREENRDFYTQALITEFSASKKPILELLTDFYIAHSRDTALPSLSQTAGTRETDPEIEERLATAVAVALRYFVSVGARVHCADTCRRTPLHYAAACGFPVLCRLLLELGALESLLATDEDGRTPLHWAAAAGCAECAAEILRAARRVRMAGVGRRAGKCELECGGLAACLCKGDKRGLFPVHVAATAGHLRCLEVLVCLHEGAGVESVGEKPGKTPLHLAAARGRLEAVRLLLSLGASPYAVAANGGTPLHFAVRGGHVLVVLQILSTADALRKRGSSEMMAEWSSVSSAQRGLPDIRVLRTARGVRGIDMAVTSSMKRALTALPEEVSQLMVAFEERDTQEKQKLSTLIHKFRPAPRGQSRSPHKTTPSPLPPNSELPPPPSPPKKNGRSSPLGVGGMNLGEGGLPIQISDGGGSASPPTSHRCMPLLLSVSEGMGGRSGESLGVGVGVLAPPPSRVFGMRCGRPSAGGGYSCASAVRRVSGALNPSKGQGEGVGRSGEGLSKREASLDSSHHPPQCPLLSPVATSVMPDHLSLECLVKRGMLPLVSGGVCFFRLRVEELEGALDRSKSVQFVSLPSQSPFVSIKEEGGEREEGEEGGKERHATGKVHLSLTCWRYEAVSAVSSDAVQTQQGKRKTATGGKGVHSAACRLLLPPRHRDRRLFVPGKRYRFSVACAFHTGKTSAFSRPSPVVFVPSWECATPGCHAVPFVPDERREDPPGRGEGHRFAWCLACGLRQFGNLYMYAS
uniref:Uncharacterized protein n=1 Tax=Chromera velia CCMP2878 TaxID=1169474 RepID=A0A0G4H8E0_9ALVE|eukprot:Cvel_25115.t1-p1 / transcript=Cvel_25115.t1 / gene=Cvel_25115 / organism=Chromera_velia_CCMP2878 / gene_product=Serine/threonine-protein phosphatase 6 regulatory, putative / transcript_product=Serine/threonine-protein phosphatase 6 regulatory, putative / location=Cvel_scaffold2803:3081-6729(-) / protein_length=804 / sequence_SO=supercontig / SO=protein_coding / is_pseudo=false